MRVARLNEHSARDRSVLQAFGALHITCTQHSQILLRAQDFESGILVIRSDDDLSKNLHDSTRRRFIHLSIESYDAAERRHRISCERAAISFFSGRARADASRVRMLDNWA